VALSCKTKEKQQKQQNFRKHHNISETTTKNKKVNVDKNLICCGFFYVFRYVVLVWFDFAFRGRYSTRI